jgi:hypothetical protein
MTFTSTASLPYWEVCLLSLDLSHSDLLSLLSSLSGERACWSLLGYASFVAASRKHHLHRPYLAIL